VTDDEFFAALERDGGAFAAACAAAPRGVRIASCPDWDIDDLLWHLTEVHWFWRRVVEVRATDWRDVGELARPAAADLPAMYRDGLASVVAVLRATDPATAVWTWSKQHDVAFIVRRMAHETAVHRWDADLAAAADGARPTIDAALASDGIDEFLEHFLRPREGARLTGSVHLHCGDVAGEWLVVPDADGAPVVTREHAKGDAAMRGTASDLLLALWRRIPLDDVEVIGDRAAAESLVTYTSLE
jgi:uncharacterized protein (TIGR03083 family)